MRKNRRWTIIAKYVSGNCSSFEKKIIKKKIEFDENFKKQVEEARLVWNLSNKEGNKWDQNKAWFKIRKRLDFEKKENAKDLSFNYRKERSSRFTLAKIVHIAALFLIATLTSVIYSHIEKEDTVNQIQEIQYQELITKKGEQKRFILSDGSKVTLAPDSKLRLSENYTTGNRDVFLTGEAFFNVISDPERPFKVHINGTITKVLGTQFNVISYPPDLSVEMAVLEGSVSVLAVKENERVFLKPGELGSYTPSKKITVRNIDVNKYLGWMEGKLIFENQPLSQITDRLERWYNIPFEIKDKEIKELTITATFNRKQPLEEVLDALALSLDIAYSKNNKSITFKRNHN
ncbi:MAG: DUF4974 domain-containing protein [Balneola sp.]|nr:DUF4974 domain-containing protein [Balneola sp.]MBO6649488.1 DUF4974 domain-containing protein [Balneola sp.]MBO6711304.1 DUF4974 domain-containing protein [Balneola sp.]MBO6800581.1 DUF4974 domain-containing protein [Balneola sp.]MBO6869240.1 DUF4974 domain-containing protein [Balneola sp.]